MFDSEIDERIDQIQEELDKLKTLRTTPELIRSCIEEVEKGGCKVVKHTNFYNGDNCFKLTTTESVNANTTDHGGLGIWLKKNRNWGLWNVYIGGIDSSVSDEKGEYIHLVFSKYSTIQDSFL